MGEIQMIGGESKQVEKVKYQGRYWTKGEKDEEKEFKC